MLPEVLIANFPLLLQGAERTLYLSAATALFSSAIGLAAALLRVFGWWPFRVAVDVYVYVVRGVPLLLLLFFTATILFVGNFAYDSVFGWGTIHLLG